MEGSAEPAAPAKRNRRRVIVILVAVAVILAGVATWWFFIRARTIAEVLSMDHFPPGAQIQVQGTVTSISWDNTSYGRKVVLGLDNDATCRPSGNVYGDPNATYRIGQTFQTTLHFQSYRVNGDPAVWAPELSCPFPQSFEAMGVVGDAVSTVTGMMFAFNGTDAGGWSHYEIVASNGASFQADRLPVVLRKSIPIPCCNSQLPAGGPVDSAARWEMLGALEYLGLAGAYQLFPTVDSMTNLTAGSSANGSLRFVDANGNGLADDGDRIDVRLPSVAGTNSWDVYQLMIGGLADPYTRYVDSIHLFLNGPEGPWDVPISARTVPRIDFGYSQTFTGATVTSSLTVTRVRFGVAPALSDVRYFIGDYPVARNGTLASLPATLANGASLAFSDANGNGRLDAGDSFTVKGLRNLTSWPFFLQTANASIAYVSWIAGYGPIVGRAPFVNGTGTGSGPWRVTAGVEFWAPALALDRTLRVTLLENGVPVVLNATLGGGTLGTFANGNLSFTDADRDGYLSTGDYFVVSGAPGNLYRLELSVEYATPYTMWGS